MGIHPPAAGAGLWSKCNGDCRKYIYYVEDQMSCLRMHMTAENVSLMHWESTLAINAALEKQKVILHVVHYRSFTIDPGFQ
jgi:hypothetical protein